MTSHPVLSCRAGHSTVARNGRVPGFRLAVTSVLACAVAACAYRAAVRREQLEAYLGDGSISKIRFLPNPGVKIVFESFSLAHPFRTVYRLDGLPKRPLPYWVDLVVPDPGDQWMKRGLYEPIRIGVPGTLKLSARDGAGQVIFECQWSPEEQGWSIDDSGAAAGYLDYLHKHAKTEETSINPEDFGAPPAGPATLEVVWEPGAGVPA